MLTAEIELILMVPEIKLCYWWTIERRQSRGRLYHSLKLQCISMDSRVVSPPSYTMQEGSTSQYLDKWCSDRPGQIYFTQEYLCHMVTSFCFIWRRQFDNKYCSLTLFDIETWLVPLAYLTFFMTWLLFVQPPKLSWPNLIKILSPSSR